MCGSYLLSLQSEFNKDLLQFFVHKVDAELLKAVSLQKENNRCQRITALKTNLLCCTICKANISFQY